MYMSVDRSDGARKRNYVVLPLERPGIFFFPLTWTVVHPITPESPLYGKTREDMEREQAEFLVLIKGYDDTFSQTVQARYSYRYDEVAWGERFTPAFEIDERGDIDVHVNRVSDHTSATA